MSDRQFRYRLPMSCGRNGQQDAETRALDQNVIPLLSVAGVSAARALVFCGPRRLLLSSQSSRFGPLIARSELKPHPVLTGLD